MRTFIIGLISIPALWAAPTVTTVCASGCDHGSLQTAINNAAAANSGPQIIVLKAGETFNTASGFTLPRRSGSYTGWITIRSSRAGELPARTRVTPSDTAKLAKVTITHPSTGSYVPAIYTNGNPSSYWRLEGLEVTLGATAKQSVAALVAFGYGYDTGDNEPSKVSHHFVVDRCYIHGLPFDNGPRDGITVNANDVEILNSYISEIKHESGETHGILGYTFSGPLLVRNNFIGGAAIGSLIGGSGTINVSVMPAGLTFVGNQYQGDPTHRALRYAGPPQGANPHPTSCSTMTLYDSSYIAGSQTYWESNVGDFYICNSWNNWVKVGAGVTGGVCVDGDFWQDTSLTNSYYLCSGGVWTTLPAVSGSNRTITGATFGTFTHFYSKNRFELKKATGVLVEGNLIENCFSPTDQQQACGAFLFNNVGISDGDWSTLREIMVQNNLVRRTVQLVNEGIESGPRYASYTHRRPRHINMVNNLVQDGSNLGVATALNKFSLYGDPITSGFRATGITLFSHGVFSHNTLINSAATAKLQPVGFITSDQPTSGRVMTDNIFELGGIIKAANWSGGGGCLSFDTYWTNRALKNNVAVQTSADVDVSAGSYYDTADCRSWAFPWKRSGTGVRNAITSASISGGLLSINFGASVSHGLPQGTRVKLAGWTPSGLNGTYTIPRLGESDNSSCSPLLLTKQYYQQYLCLPTAVTGSVTPGTIEASVDYADYAAQNFRLASTSAYKGWATDGSDPGANQDMVEWATATASSGADNQYLDFRVRSISPTADGAILRLTAYSTADCTWTISSTRAFADSLGAVAQSRAGRDGMATITGLASSTGYWYRVSCDSRNREGEFVSGR